MTRFEKLRITEIFHSLQGETSRVGLPTVFIRLTGCPLRCQYCDTTYAFRGGIWKTIESIIAEVKKYETPFVTVTGGEPLAQKNVFFLLKKLCDEGFDVSLETSGAILVADVDKRVKKIIDVKTPGSGEVEKNKFENFDNLFPFDEIKFVVCSREDYEWSKKIMTQYNLNSRCSILFAPSYQQLSATELAEWILQDKLNVRLQIQLHKMLWGEAKGK